MRRLLAGHQAVNMEMKDIGTAVNTMLLPAFRIVTLGLLSILTWLAIIVYNKADVAAPKAEMQVAVSEAKAEAAKSVSDAKADASRSSLALWDAMTRNTKAQSDLVDKQNGLTTSVAVLQSNLTAHIQADLVQSQAVHEALQVIELARGHGGIAPAATPAISPSRP